MSVIIQNLFYVSFTSSFYASRFYWRGRVISWLLWYLWPYSYRSIWALPLIPFYLNTSFIVSVSLAVYTPGSSPIWPINSVCAFVSCHLVFRWLPPIKALPLDRCFFRYTRHLFSGLLSHSKFISSSMQTTRNSTWLCRLSAIHMIFLHLSLVWTLFAFGFVKMAWPSTLYKSVVILLGTSQRLTSLSGLKSVNVAGTVIPVSDKLKIYSVHHLIPTSQWNLAPKLYPVPAFITSAHLNRFGHPWMTPWLGPRRLGLFHPVLIMLTLSYTVRR